MNVLNEPAGKVLIKSVESSEGILQKMSTEISRGTTSASFGKNSEESQGGFLQQFMQDFPKEVFEKIHGGTFKKSLDDLPKQLLMEVFLICVDVLLKNPRNFP